MTLSADLIRPPEPKYILAVEASENLFRDQFGALTAEEWRDLLVKSTGAPIIDGIEFPKFPDQELQFQLHGSAGADALHEPYDFYCFIRSRPYLRRKLGPESSFLDFGAGWGRMSRMFLRDFDLCKMYGFEPQRGTCLLARSLNPYMCFLNGDTTPNGTLPPNRFDLVVSWSIFTHLSEASTGQWFEELARTLRPDGYCVATTWGERFLITLAEEQRKLDQAIPIHWYYQLCLDAAEDIDGHIERYRRGEFTWFGPGHTELYGAASFLPPAAIRGMLRERDLPLELVDFDSGSLTQDAFILHRR